jgi:hypothetical protein
VAKFSLILLLFLCSCHFQLAVVSYNNMSTNLIDYDSNEDEFVLIDFGQYRKVAKEVYDQLFPSTVKDPAVGAFEKWGPK